MGVRSLSELRRVQATMLETLRDEAKVTEVGSPGERVDVVATLARVTSVITSDPEFGAHLVVQAQSFGGTPAVSSDASRPTMRIYPTPNHVVTDYAVGEFVLLLTCRGAVLGMKLGS